MCDASGSVSLGRRWRRRKEGSDDMTYLGGLFTGCCVVHWDMVGIAHGEESINCAVLVAVHRVDDRVPIKNGKGKKKKAMR